MGKSSEVFKAEVEKLYLIYYSAVAPFKTFFSVVAEPQSEREREKNCYIHTCLVHFLLYY